MDDPTSSNGEGHVDDTPPAADDTTSPDVAAMFTGLYGAQWGPHPMAYQVSTGAIGGQPAIFLQLETTIGRLNFAISPDDAKKFAAALIDKATGGLQVVQQPRLILPPSGRN